MTDYIDNFLNKITMYRLALYYLLTLLAVAAVFGFFGAMSYSPLSILFSGALITLVCLMTNVVFARVFKASTNVESVYITALILTLIITPIMPSQFSGWAFLIWAGIWAMASKYIFAIGKKHIFNPAAFAIALTAITINQAASWWIGGNLPMLAFVLIGGLFVIRKVQRFDLTFAFLGSAFVTVAAFYAKMNPLNAISKALIHSPILFFAAIMLTEPLTTPPTRFKRILYGLFVGFLFAPAVHIGSVYSTPELALLIGNLFSYFISPKRKLLLTLKEKVKIGADMYDFVFESDRKLNFKPGQYLEWTLPHRRSDSRGNRRYFTIASSPTENTIRIGVKFYKDSSSFKKSLLSMKLGDTIGASQVAGDFVLPRNKKKKLAFIMGGIGITPLRSMVKYLLDNKEQRSIIIFYSNKIKPEILYKEIFDEAERQLGVKTIYTLTDIQAVPLDWNGSKGFIDSQMIMQAAPDYKERTFYISGPHGMVVDFRKALKSINVKSNKIKTDFFPGFA